MLGWSMATWFSLCCVAILYFCLVYDRRTIYLYYLQWNHSLCSVRVRNENQSLDAVLSFFNFFFYNIYNEFLVYLIAVGGGKGRCGGG